MTSQGKYKFIKYLACLFLILCSFFIFKNTKAATTTIISQVPTNSTDGTNIKWHASNFYATSTLYINTLGTKEATNTDDTYQVKLQLCEGTCNDVNCKNDCNSIDSCIVSLQNDEQVGYCQFLNTAVISSDFYLLAYRFDELDNYFNLFTGTDDYDPRFKSAYFYDPSLFHGAPSFQSSDPGYIIMLYDDEIDFFTDDTEVIELPDWQGQYGVESEYELVFDYQNYCTIGITCRIWVNYNSEVIGDTIYLLDSDSNDNCNYNLSQSVDNFEPIDGLLLQDYFNILATTTPVTDYYCILDDTNDNGGVDDEDIVYKGITLKWFDEPTILDDYFSEYDCDTICDSISTSSESFWDGARFGIECGFRKIICWSLVPSNDSLIKFARATYTIENQFPFSVFNQVSNEIQGTELATSATSSISINFSQFGLPLDEDLTLFDPEDIKEKFGQLGDTVDLAIATLIYIFGFLYFVFRIYKISRKETAEE